MIEALVAAASCGRVRASLAISVRVWRRDGRRRVVGRRDARRTGPHGLHLLARHARQFFQRGRTVDHPPQPAHHPEPAELAVGKSGDALTRRQTGFARVVRPGRGIEEDRHQHRRRPTRHRACGCWLGLGQPAQALDKAAGIGLEVRRDQQHHDISVIFRAALGSVPQIVELARVRELDEVPVHERGQVAPELDEHGSIGRHVGDMELEHFGHAVAAGRLYATTSHAQTTPIERARAGSRKRSEISLPTEPAPSRSGCCFGRQLRFFLAKGQLLWKMPAAPLPSCTGASLGSFRRDHRPLSNP